MQTLLIGAAVCAAMLIGAYQAGVKGERERGEAASLRAQLAIARADLDAARRAEADALSRAAALDLAAAANKDALDELEASLRSRPALGRCALDSGDRRRLLNIR